jgi:hypothetical protein
MLTLTPIERAVVTLEATQTPTLSAMAVEIQKVKDLVMEAVRQSDFPGHATEMAMMADALAAAEKDLYEAIRRMQTLVDVIENEPVE